MKIFSTIILLTTILIAGSHVFVSGQTIRFVNDKTVFDYSPSQNETTVRSPNISLFKMNDLGSNTDEYIDGLFNFKYPGHSLTAPAFIELRVISRSENSFKFEQDISRNISIIADGENILTGLMDRPTAEKYHTLNLAFMQYREVMAISIPTESLLKALPAKKIVIQLGDRKFKLSKDALKAMQDYLSLAKI